MNEWILIWKLGTMGANNEATQGYYLVEWMSESYTVHKNAVINRVDPTHTAFPGEIIYYTMFWNPALNATDWYISIIKKFGFVIIRLK